MAWILNLETASTNCSVALFEGDQLRSIREDRSPQYTHGEQLHLFIEGVLEDAGVGRDQVDAIAVSKGPGSYTGLRIGVASAKGLCFALDRPLIALPTLKVLAAGLPGAAGLRVPMLDARRMEVYAAIYNTELQAVKGAWSEVLDNSSFADYHGAQQFHIMGPGALKASEVLQLPNAQYYPDLLPSARAMGPLAYTAFREGNFEDLAYFEPYYLKDFIVTTKKPS